MYGGQFKQSFGWYIQQEYYRLGIRPQSHEYVKGVCPEYFCKLIDIIKKSQAEYLKELERLNRMVKGPDRPDITPDEITYWHNVRIEEAQPMIKLRRNFQKMSNKLKKSIEDIVRQEFGFKKIGEGWVSETLLFQIITRLFPNEYIIRNDRPEWLDGLELDIHLPKLNVGIEYQGQQHYKSVPIWGGKKALIEQQKRDARKKKKCNEKGVILIEVDYTEPLTEEYIYKKFNDANIKPYVHNGG